MTVLPKVLALVAAWPLLATASGELRTGGTPLQLDWRATRPTLPSPATPRSDLAATRPTLQTRIQRAADARDWYGQAIQRSIDAVVDCQKGDYPGGGMGLLSMPGLRPASPSDHCRKL